jgi:hypothetical protein
VVLVQIIGDCESRKAIGHELGLRTIALELLIVSNKDRTILSDAARNDPELETKIEDRVDQLVVREQVGAVPGSRTGVENSAEVRGLSPFNDSFGEERVQLVSWLK